MTVVATMLRTTAAAMLATHGRRLAARDRAAGRPGTAALPLSRRRRGGRKGNGSRAPGIAVLAHVRERPLAQVGRRRGPDHVAQQRRRATEALELAGARIAAREVTGDRRSRRRIARHQPRQPIGLDGCQLELFEYLVVIHAAPLRSSQRSGPAIGTGARYLVNSGPTPDARTSRRRRSARRVRVLTVPSGQPSRSAISVCDRSSP